ncbi:hypothetical protein [Erysipelothrix sp. HDW6A]|nr:hypothetical protein [Erysipelothrix sp. HDW6A]
MTQLESEFYHTMIWVMRDILQELINLNENIEQLKLKEQKENE